MINELMPFGVTRCLGIYLFKSLVGVPNGGSDTSLYKDGLLV